MGYRGKVVERVRARDLRAQAWTLADIAEELCVSKGTLSVWVRDVEFEPNPRRASRKRGPNRLERAKAAEIEHCRRIGVERVGSLSDREFLMAGLGLYLHADLDLDSAIAHWAAVTGIPAGQFTKPYRAVVDETRRHNRHINGCCHVVYSSTRVHREILGLMDALLAVS